MGLDAAPRGPGGPFRLAAWVGSEPLADALSGAPCGCARVAEALRETNPRARAANVAVARERCAAWRCPRDGHAPGPLGPAERQALGAVSRLTGYAATTCPMEAAYRPEVRRVARAKRYPHLEPDPPAVLVDALDAMGAGEADLLEWIRENPSRRTPLTTPAQGPISDPNDLPRRKGRAR